MVSSVAMIASTTMSSMRVKPPARFAGDPLVRGSKNVLALLRVLRRAGVAALAPGLAERVRRQAAQEINALALRAFLVLDALDQVLEALGKARFAHALHDAAVVGGLLVGVDRGADLAQRAAQGLLLRALHHQLVQRQGGGGEDRDDRHRDHQLDEGEALHSGAGLTPPNGTITLPVGFGASGAAGEVWGAAGEICAHPAP